MQIKITEDKVNAVYAMGKYFAIQGHQAMYEADTVILACGMSTAKPFPGELENLGRGVSYCATCDGAFFRGKTVAVVGGGDVALEDAIFLARMCEKVYVIHRRDELRGAKSLQTKLFSLENVEVIWDTVVEEITGSVKVESLKLLNKKTQEHTELEVDGVFIAVGIEPDSGAYAGEVALDGQGYVIAGEDGCTSESGVFAAGDIRTKLLRQVITAAADGAVCVTSAERYLAEK